MLWYFHFEKFEKATPKESATFMWMVTKLFFFHWLKVTTRFILYETEPQLGKQYSINCHIKEKMNIMQLKVWLWEGKFIALNKCRNSHINIVGFPLYFDNDDAAKLVIIRHLLIGIRFLIKQSKKVFIRAIDFKIHHC